MNTIIATILKKGICFDLLLILIGLSNFRSSIFTFVFLTFESPGRF